MLQTWTGVTAYLVRDAGPRARLLGLNLEPIFLTVGPQTNHLTLPCALRMMLAQEVGMGVKWNLPVKFLVHNKDSISCQLLLCLAN